MKKEAGFIKQILIIVVLALLVFSGYVVYKAIVENKGDLTLENIKGVFSKKAEEEKNRIVDEAKKKASEAIKNQVDETLGTGHTAQ